MKLTTDQVVLEALRAISAKLPGAEEYVITPRFASAKSRSVYSRWPTCA